MAAMDRRLRLWAWLVRRQASIAGKSEAEVFALQSRPAPSNPVTNFIFETVAGRTEVTDRTMPGPDGDLPARIYRPAAAPAGPRPLVLYLHGGGFVFGDLPLCDWLCSNVALGAAGPAGVMGESAGGNLSAVLCLLARDRGGPAQAAALAQPGTETPGTETTVS
jgi:acetyl esterase/lipase